MHFNLDLPGVDVWLRESSNLGELVTEALLSRETRPRTSGMGNQLLLALRGVNLNPGSDPENMISLSLWTDGDRVITTRLRHLLSVADVRDNCAVGNGYSKTREHCKRSHSLNDHN